MNKQRRQNITGISNNLRELQSRIDTLKDEEQDYYDNIPENLQESERAETASNAIDNLQSAFDGLEEVIGYLDEAAQ